MYTFIHFYAHIYICIYTYMFTQVEISYVSSGAAGGSAFMKAAHLRESTKNLLPGNNSRTSERLNLQPPTLNPTP